MSETILGRLRELLAKEEANLSRLETTAQAPFLQAMALAALAEELSYVEKKLAMISQSFEEIAHDLRERGG